MDAPTPETIWKIIAGVVSTIVAACLSVLGIQYNRYQRDRHTLLELKRKMAELDAIRAKTDDGRTPLAVLERLGDRLNTMATALETVIERQDASDERQNTMALSVGKTETNVEWIKRHLEAGPNRR